MKPKLSIPGLQEVARAFSRSESRHNEPTLYGVTDGKAIGTYLEHKFRDLLAESYEYELGNSAKGIDFPEISVDVKTTSIKQPQSSCPFKSARQKVFGLGYSLLVFVYEKSDDQQHRTGRLDIHHAIFVDAPFTADFQTTSGLRSILANDANEDDIVAFFQDRNLPLDDIQAHELAKEVLRSPPEVGYLTISNALQWRLQYNRVIDKAGSVNGVYRVV